MMLKREREKALNKEKEKKEEKNELESVDFEDLNTSSR